MHGMSRATKIKNSIDCHLHLVGTGSAGSGCSLSLKGIRRLHASVMLRALGLPLSALRENFDRLYIERIVSLLRSSPVEKAVLLANDYVHADDGTPQPEFSHFYTPNAYVLAIAAQYPDLFIPAISIHPYKKNAVEELHDTVQQGARVLKLLPLYHRIDLASDRSKAFFEEVAKLKVIFLCHTGGELSLPVTAPAFISPRILETPLSLGVTCIAAHCGTPSLPWQKGWVNDFLAMAKIYPHLYGDNSALTSPFRAMSLPALLQSDAVDRILYGSDLPIPISASSALTAGRGMALAIRLAQIANPLTRDVAFKTTCGFKEKSWTTLTTLLPVSSVAVAP